jgi:uncharacterized protein (DUF58 family)
MKPGRPLFILALVWFLLGTAAFFSGPLSLAWFFLGLFLLFLSAADGAFLTLLAGRPGVRRELAPSLAQGERARVRITVIPQSGFFIPAVQLWDLYPPSMDCGEDGNALGVFPASLSRRLLKKGPLVFEYTLVPRERGNWTFRGMELLLSSPLGLWRLKLCLREESRGRTYPDFRKIKAAAGTELRAFLERTGVKRIRRRGPGLEFESLREFQEGDSVKAIDWRAASRNRQLDGRLKLIVREDQEEMDLQVLILLDTGYRLHRPEYVSGTRRAGDSPGEFRLQFDSALEAALLLSWVSLKHGDSIGVGCFGGLSRWTPPRKGLRGFTALMNSLYDLKSAPVPSSPSHALEEALSRLKRRSLIILISNFREEDGESLSWIINRTKTRHLLLLVSLLERESVSLAAHAPRNSEEALVTAAAFSYLAGRREICRRWERMGLLVLESSAAELTPALINRYLDLKRSGLL